MQLRGVDFKSGEPEVMSSASPSNAIEGAAVLTPEYNALKVFYKMRDDSKNQSPLLKRLSVRYDME
jgi:hypothetical protein